MSPAVHESSRLLRTELGRLLVALEALLRRQRRRGRSVDGDAVDGLVIEEGEAEGLLGELFHDWTSPARSAPTPPPARSRTVGPEAQPGRDEPLVRVVRAFDLGPVEFDALLLALAVEVDARFGRLVAYLNDHVARTRPTLGMVLALAAVGGREPPSPTAFCELPVIRDGLLELDGETPLPGLILSVPRDLIPRLLSPCGATCGGCTCHPPEIGLLDRLVLNEETRGRLRAWSDAQRQARPCPPLLLYGPGGGRTTAARAAAAAAGRPLVVVGPAGEDLAERLRVGRREARLNDALLLVRHAPAAPPPDWARVWAGLDGLGRPPLLALNQGEVEAAIASAPREPAVVELGEPDVQARALLWRALLPPGEPIDDRALDDLASRFRFNPGRIARAIRRATAEVGLASEGNRRLTPEVLGRACRSIGSGAMGTLAQKLPATYSRADLIVPPHLDAELDLALSWVRRQKQVLHYWGFARRMALGRGLTALFSGPPGTGKTMAAQVLASELGVDLYRVDLSRVMSKYIGETEKNLARLFDEAQAAGCMLFFDEAEALFGKRSEVKDAHDRYANVEIGYLLQRMEEYEGVTVLATNRHRDLDEAFLRRFQVILDFPMPGEADRLRLWRGMFPAEAERSAEIDLHRLAREFEMTGGEIRNTVLAAAYMAAGEATRIGMTHLRRAIRRELAKGGRVVTAE